MTTVAEQYEGQVEAQKQYTLTLQDNLQKLSEKYSDIASSGADSEKAKKMAKRIETMKRRYEANREKLFDMRAKHSEKKRILKEKPKRQQKNHDKKAVKKTAKYGNTRAKKTARTSL